MESEEIEGGHFWSMRKLSVVILGSEEIEGGHFRQVRRLRGSFFTAKSGSHPFLCLVCFGGRRPFLRFSSIFEVIFHF